MIRARTLRLPALVWFAALTAPLGAQIGPSEGAGDADLPLILSEDFEEGAGRWEPTDSEAWKITRAGSERGNVYSLFGKSDYTPPHRSPHNIALLKDVSVSDFVLELKLRSTKEMYNHLDMCLFFGYQDPAHFYYVHLGKRTDDHANQIFIVNEEARTKISTRTTPGTPWDDQWHVVRIVRGATDGKIEVYYDNLEEPVMTAVDKTFTWGRIGIGSFDDTGDFDDLKLYGRKASDN